VLSHARETRRTTPTFALSSVSPGSTATRAFAYTQSRMSALAFSYPAVRPRKILSPLATPNMTAILSAAHKITAMPTPHCKLAREYKKASFLLQALLRGCLPPYKGLALSTQAPGQLFSRSKLICVQHTRTRVSLPVHYPTTSIDPLRHWLFLLAFVGRVVVCVCVCVCVCVFVCVCVCNTNSNTGILKAPSRTPV
jgi:hypothetical protein